MKELFKYILIILVSFGALSESLYFVGETLFLEQLEKDVDTSEEGKGFGKDKIVQIKYKVDGTHYVYSSNIYCLADSIVEGEDHSECTFLPPEV